MRTVDTNLIKNTVTELFISANYKLPDDIIKKIKSAEVYEKTPIAEKILSKLSENVAAAEKINVPVCQDTGMAVVFLEIGQEVSLSGMPLEDAVNQGVCDAYELGYMRKSVVSDPLFNRKNTNDNTPAIIYTKIVSGDKIKITASPKGFGSENMSAIKMFTPSATKDDIVDFVVETVVKAGSNPCPPIVLGIGIGGDFEYAAYLSKLALTRDTETPNPDARYAELEKEILEKVNKTGIGPQGFGGDTTCLAVNIEYYPTHIAGLPCAVNVGCHVTRHKTAII